MTTEAEAHRVFPRLTLRRVDVLRGLASGHSESEIARELGLAVNGVRSHIEALRTITGLSGVRELGRWWRAHGPAWAEYTCRRGGLEIVVVATDWNKGTNLP
jgi:DNA-binding NarL/FixJ family response regulator